MGMLSRVQVLWNFVVVVPPPWRGSGGGVPGPSGCERVWAPNFVVVVPPLAGGVGPVSSGEFLAGGVGTGLVSVLCGGMSAQ